MKGSEAGSLARQVAQPMLLASVGILVFGGAAVFVVPDRWVALVTLGVSVSVLTYVAWARAKRAGSGPVLELTEAIRQIAATKRYDARVPTPPTSELAVLADAVNGLVGQTQEELGALKQVHSEELGARTQALSEELEAVNEKLKAAEGQAAVDDHSRSQFVANITHELRTPMNGVFGMTELLLSTTLTPQQRKYTKAIMDSAEDLLAIVNNILDFSKVEAGKFERIDNKPFSPKECVERVQDLLVARAEQEGLSLSCEFADRVPPAMLGDGKRLRQVLINLVGNAIKFTDRGTIVVRTSLVGSEGHERTIRFEVVDTGIGVPEFLHKDIFEGYSQADTSTTRQFGGTGLGLAISKHLVELMGGEIGLVSRPGVGSNFWFTIRADVCARDTEELDLGGLRALVVATATGSGDELRRQLGACRAEGVVVTSAEEAAAATASTVEGERPFDVVLIDPQGLQVPSVVGELRGNPATSSVPVVVVSTVRRTTDALKQEGIDGLLTKPFCEEDVFACLNDLLGVRAPAGQAAGESAPRETPTFPGVRILLAEDNRVNQEVAKTMLEALQCSVHVVGDGAAAIDAVRHANPQYDLVFLDCEMPNVDGYRAIREIRKLESDGGIGATERSDGHLPVVALTAYTSPTDRKRGLENGMDDYVAKPFTFRNLVDVIARWTDADTDVATPSPLVVNTLSPQREADAESPIDESALQQIRDLDQLTGGDLFARVARIFLKETPAIIEDLQTAVTDGEPVRMARAAHALKSSSLNVGAVSMSRLCRELEVMGKGGNVGDAAPLATKLSERYLQVKDALESRLEQKQPDTVASV